MSDMKWLTTLRKKLKMSLIHRAFKISNSCIIFQNELENIKILLQKTCTLKKLLIIE